MICLTKHANPASPPPLDLAGYKIMRLWLWLTSLCWLSLLFKILPHMVFALQLIGILSGSVAAVIQAILSAVGFSALGPVGSSAAAGSQASLGIIEAGSLYAWCLSAAMGRAAVSAVICYRCSGWRSCGSCDSGGSRTE